MARTTKTLNPLPLQDLDPHRFEDLIRQLVYDYRHWQALEAVGRSGSDRGIDILGREEVAEPQDAGDGASSESEVVVPQTRLWVFQCKREKAIGPTKVRSIVSKFFRRHDTRNKKRQVPVHGYVIAAACDFSLAAREAFATEVARFGVTECHMWGKGEIEDQLVQPKNDHLLFAFFSLSLRVRRASQTTLIRSRLTLKNRLVADIGGTIDAPHSAEILIRDPEGTYPYVGDAPDFAKKPRWRYWTFWRHDPPDHMSFVVRKFFAYGDWETGHWDYIPDHDLGALGLPEVAGIGGIGQPDRERDDILRTYWLRNVRSFQRAWLVVLRSISYDRILAFDKIGDSWNPGRHLFVSYRGDDPFDSGDHAVLVPLDTPKAMWLYPGSKDDSQRTRVFPAPIPDEREAYRAEIKAGRVLGE